MANYDIKKWSKRHFSRSDIGIYLTHLTKSKNGLSAVQVLIKILNEKKLLGSDHTGYISGENKAVCFQDAPLYGIGQNILHEEEYSTKERYVAVGLMFTKSQIFNKGGRPVIYGTKEENERLYSHEKWRTVTLDFSDKKNIIDWTHEREWRLKGDLEFKLEDALVVLPNKDTYQYFIENAGEEILKKVRGIVTMQPILA